MGVLFIKEEIITHVITMHNYPPLSTVLSRGTVFISLLAYIQKKSEKNGKIKINRCSSGTNQLSDYLKAAHKRKKQ